MKRLRMLFAGGLALFFLPLWRLLDYLVFLWPGTWPYTILFTFMTLIFLGIPLRLIQNKIKPIFIFMGIICLGALNLYLTPISGEKSSYPMATHCGYLTYTGFFSPLKPILTQAFEDDLTLRNQLCWIRKLIMNSPQGYRDDLDQEQYLRSLEKLLLEPQDKYLASLPMLAWLYGGIATRMKLSGGEFFVSTLHFWKDHYTVIVSGRPYAWWDWPLSAIIQWEYGLIENNWEDIIENVQIEGP